MTVDEMKNVDIRTVDRGELVDIRDVSIDRTLFCSYIEIYIPIRRGLPAVVIRTPTM